MKTSDVLREARSLLNESSWVGRIPTCSKEHCALSALGVVHFPFLDRNGAYGALRRVLPCDYSSVAQFNDDPETSLGDVLALYDRAIAACEKDGD